MPKRPISHKQLASAYHVCTRTLTSWIAPFREKLEIKPKQHLYTPKQVTGIFDNLGTPDDVRLLIEQEIERN